MAQRENPFDVLPLGRQIRRENFLVGILPWFLLMAVEGTFLYLATMTNAEESILALYAIELIAVPLVMAYAAQIHSIRTFENLWRRVRFEDIAVTCITAEDILDWLMKNMRRVQVMGLVIYALFIVGSLFWLVVQEGLDLLGNWAPYILPLIIARLLPILSVGRSAAYIGFVKLFEIENYFKGRAVAVAIIAWKWLDVFLILLIITVCADYFVNEVGLLLILAVGGILYYAFGAPLRFSYAELELRQRAIEQFDAW